MADYLTTKNAGQINTRVGDVFGRLTVVARAENRKDRTFWLCRCECGTEREYSANNLRNGQAKSCGCTKRKHGGIADKHLAYQSWVGMIARCTNPKRRHYNRYGGRGIKVCERWRNSYADFLEDMGERPSAMHSIDRIDNDGDYEPGNCRWSLSEQQQRNRSGLRMMTLHGKTMCVKDWADSVGMNAVTLRSRLRNGMSLEDAIAKPVKPSRGKK